MGVAIFFSLSALVIVLGLGLTALTIRHHWRLSRHSRVAKKATAEN